MLKLKNDILDSIKKFTLLDDTFMTKVFENDIECTQFILRIIFNDDKIKVKEVTTQKRIKNLQGRDLQLDILAEKADGTKFNVEVQNENKGAIPQRARYHMSILDSNSLPAGKYFNALPDNYVIFITKNDVLNANLPIYHIHRTIDETGKSFADGSHIIYVNSKIQDDTPLGRLMHDFCCKDPEKMHYKELADKTRYFKQETEGLKTMGNVMEQLIKKREKEYGNVMEQLMKKREREMAKKYELKIAKVEAKVAKEKAKAEAKAAEEKAKAEAKAAEEKAKAEAKAAEEKAKAEAKAAKAEKIAFAMEMFKNHESMEKILLYTKLSQKEVAALAAKVSA